MLLEALGKTEEELLNRADEVHQFGFTRRQFLLTQQTVRYRGRAKSDLKCAEPRPRFTLVEKLFIEGQVGEFGVRRYLVLAVESCYGTVNVFTWIDRRIKSGVPFVRGIALRGNNSPKRLTGDGPSSLVETNFDPPVTSTCEESVTRH